MIFLKRCSYPGVSSKEFYIGAIITVYGRQLKLIEYGDVATRKKFEVDAQRTFAMIKPDAYVHMGKIIDAIYMNGFKIKRMKMSKFSNATSSIFYGEHKDRPFFPNL